MRAVASHHYTVPDPVHHLKTGKVSPVTEDVPFISAFIDQNRLMEKLHILFYCCGIPLQRTVCDILFAEIIVPDHMVTAKHMAIDIFLTDKAVDPVPVLPGKGSHTVIFIGEAPPDIRKRAESGHKIVKIGKILFFLHLRKAPTVIGMK